MGIDLHIHTNISSDGEFTAKEIGEMAKTVGLQAIAITDHDTVEGVEEGIYWGDKLGIEVIPGVEISAEYHGRWMHILGYFIDIQNQDLIRLGEKVREDRLQDVDRQIKTLQDNGFYLEKKKVLEVATGDTPLYSAYSTAIFEDQRNQENPIIKSYLGIENYILRFCEDYMVRGKTAFIDQFIPDAVDVLSVIRQSGGIPILAHPGSGLGDEDDNLIDELLPHGLKGLEVITSRHNEAQEKHYLNYCQAKNLVYTCGSDFHGKLKPYIKLGQIHGNDYKILERLRKISQSF
ncbi:PHP domain-containing protein [Desulfitobacterium sp. AusDCA]|uniref:PHP domain-containing protein n=1 Tax=Desulfitobacterium sp. AusDCA TaxID=3240383 RepID=UPI003DA776F8